MARTRKGTEQTTHAVEEPIEDVLENLPARDEDGLVTAGIVEETIEQAEPRLCACGCGEPVVSKKATFAPKGHDMKFKSALLARHDQGDETATAELIERGWRTAGQLAARGQKGQASNSSKVERLDAKVAKLQAKIAELQAQEERLLAELQAAIDAEHGKEAA